MSNLIKASQISYKEDVRKIDMNQRAEEVENRFLNDYYASNIANKQIDFNEVSAKLEEERVLTPEDLDFTPGIVTEQVYANEDGDEVTAPSRQEDGILEIEARVREGKRELEELEKKIEEAHKTAEQIISDADAQAQTIIEDAERQAQDNIAQAMEEARNEGLEQGRELAREENEQAKAELEQLKESYKADYEKQVDDMEPAFVEILIKYIKKLTGIYAEDKRDIILHLIDNAMKDKHGTENFIIRVSEADFAVVSYSKDAIRGYLSEGAQLEVVSDKLLERNQCMIETESRIFDCSLDGQLMSLIEDIRLLAEKE